MANPMLQMMQGVLYAKGIRLGTLSPLGRVIASMTGAHADMVPFMGPQIHDHAMTVARVPAWEYYWNAKLLVDVHLAICRWYGFDSGSIIADAYNFEVEALGATMIYSDNAMPTVDTTRPIISVRDDLKRLGPLDVSKGRIPMAVELAGIVTRKVPGPFGQGFFCSPFSMLCQAMSYPRAVRAIKRDPEFARELFAYVENDVLMPFFRAQRAAGAKSATGADAWAAFPNLTPELVEEWVVPSAKRLGALAKKELGMTVSAGMASADYCEEDPAKFDKDVMFRCWDTAAKTSFLKVALSAMGRTQDWNMEWLREFAESRGNGKKRLPIFASLNGRFVRDNSPETIAAKVREWIDLLARGGSVLFFIGNVPADTPPINVHAAVHAVRTYGKYPIAKDLSSIEFRIPEVRPFDDWLKGQPEEEIIRKARELPVNRRWAGK